ncbi:MAG: glycosyltransferase [bacterium]|jgi:hypothetical protein|nr:glycosyltransferase [bacterium]
MPGWKPLSDPRKATFERNIAYLNKAGLAWAAALAERKPLLTEMELWEEGGEIRGVRFVSPSRPSLFLDPSTASPLLQNQRNAIDEAIQQGTLCLVLAGIGAGNAVQHIWEAIQANPRYVVLCVEPQPLPWLVVATLYDIAAMQESGRVLFFGGPHAWRMAAQGMQTRYLFLLDQRECRLILGGLPCESSKQDSSIQAARDFYRQIKTALPRFEAEVDRFRFVMATPLDREPQTIWSCASPNAYIHHPITKAVLQGFQRNGLRTHLAEFSPSISAQSQVLGELLMMSPDLILTINAWPNALLEDIGLQSTLVNQIQRPRLCWLVDDTSLYENPVGTFPLAPNHWYLCCDRSYLAWLRPHTRRAYYLPVATMLEGPGRLVERFAAPLSYIGSLPDVGGFLQIMTPACRELIARLDRLKTQEPARPYRDLLLSLQPTPSQLDQIKSAARAFCLTTKKGLTEAEPILAYFLYNAVTYEKRKRIVLALLPLGLKVFGPESWRQILPPPYQDRYGGFVAHPDLADAYYSARLSVNIHSHQCPTCLNPRDFDVPMAGGLVLGDYVPDADRGLILPGKEMLVFHQEDEMRDLASQALANEDRMSAMRAEVHHTVRNRHTYTHRAQTILQWLQEPLAWISHDRDRKRPPDVVKV